MRKTKKPEKKFLNIHETRLFVLGCSNTQAQVLHHINIQRNITKNSTSLTVISLQFLPSHRLQWLPLCHLLLSPHSPFFLHHHSLLQYKYAPLLLCLTSILLLKLL
ncbi:hypothetical protein MANES_05G022401v8 [Manihot esculenta]|uniref:Uncharacterized protein n=1 Tax=Manihot esculenta TaxID=3983 RepID=A0ACB7HNS5_MANES|nr:hypothetical protein MANES_05G022401v8 [Manihot esculenta]